MISSFYIRNFIHRFAKNDNWHNLNHKTNNLGYGWLHYGFIRNLNPQRVLCIGSKYGYVPAICALACKNNKQGRVDFVDANFSMYETDEQQSGAHWGGVGFWTTSKGKRQFHKFGLNKYIQPHIMTTETFFNKYPTRKWEYIHLDGDHSYSGIKFDFNHAWQRLMIGGFIAFHDIYTPDTDGNKYGTRQFWQELKANSKYNTFELPGLCGLGFIQK